MRYGLMGLAACLITLFAALFRMPPEAARYPQSNPSAHVGLARLDEGLGNVLLREEARLHDPSPLFLPTDLNSAQLVHPERSFREPGDSMGTFPAKMVFSGTSIALALAPSVSVPATPADELALPQGNRPLVSLGQKDAKPVLFAARSALLQIARAGEGGNVESLPKGFPIEGQELPTEVLWQPLEFLVVVDSAGLVGQPALNTSSGVEAVDRFFQEYLSKRWSFIEKRGRLSHGRYLITLGP
jgi:hypothetical protein